MSRSRIIILAELVIFFFGMPIALYFHATRWNVHVALWAVALYCLIRLKKVDKIPWRKIWHGDGWPLQQRKTAILRFGVAAGLIVLLTHFIAPQRMFGFPMQRPIFWLLVMVLYPPLSVIPQEFVFRSYFFRRYRPLFADERLLVAASAMAFAFVHIVFHNPVSPTLCLIAGAIFASSYNRHQSLKWAVIEHAAYGCMVFTVGIGYFFLVGGGSMH